MDFPQALRHIKEGDLLTRDGWNAPGMSVARDWPMNGDAHLALTLPNGAEVFWLPAQTDLVAQDWRFAQIGAATEVEQPGERVGSFSMALEQVLLGGRACRGGWHGVEQFIFLVPGSTFEVNRLPLLGIYPEGTVINYQPHIDIRLVGEGNRIVPWTATNADIMENDWTMIGGSVPPLD